MCMRGRELYLHCLLHERGEEKKVTREPRMEHTGKECESGVTKMTKKGFQYSRDILEGTIDA